MPRRIETLTDEQQAAMAGHAEKWIQFGLDRGPVDWAAWEKGARACYDYAGIPWPDRVVRVPSPLVGALAAPIAAYVIALRRSGLRVAVGGAVRDAVGDAVHGAVDVAVDVAVDDAVRGAVGGAVGDAVHGAVHGAVRGAVGDAVDVAVDVAVRGAVGGAVGDAVGGAVHGAVRDAVDDAVRGAVGDAVHGAVHGAVRGAVGDAVDVAVDVAVRGAVRDAVGDAVGGAVHGAVRDAVDDAVRGAVRGAVGDAVHGAVRGAVGDAVGVAVDVAVRGAVRDAVGDAVDVAVDVAVRGAVRDAVGVAVDDAVRGAVDGAVHDAVRKGVGAVLEQLKWSRLGGQWWVSWLAWRTFFRDVCDLELDPGMWERSYAYEQASTAGWWFPYKDFVMVSERPTQLHLEQVGPTGWGSHRLHREDGPAIAWADGWALWYWHGVRVSQDLIEGDGWGVERIMRETNSEIRRAAIERRGWDKFVDEAGFAQVGATVDDPGNPGQQLALYDIPRQIFNAPVRVLLMTNGSPDRNGGVRRYGETVPGHLTDPIAAAAWQYDVPEEVYATLQRRT